MFSHRLSPILSYRREYNNTLTHEIKPSEWERYREREESQIINVYVTFSIHQENFFLFNQPTQPTHTNPLIIIIISLIFLRWKRDFQVFPYVFVWESKFVSTHTAESRTKKVGGTLIHITIETLEWTCKGGYGIPAMLLGPGDSYRFSSFFLRSSLVLRLHSSSSSSSSSSMIINTTQIQ